MSGITVLLDINFLLTRVFSHFDGKFSVIKLSVSIFIDKLQDIGFIPSVESQSDCQKFNIQCLVFNN